LLALVALVVLTLTRPSLQAQQFKDVDAAVRHGIEKGLYPGAVVVIGRRDTILYAKVTAG